MNTMDNFEKVEKLVQKAGVTYEEAKNALERANGDLLDAMILLEREGKTQPAGGTYSTQYEDQAQYIPVDAQTTNARGGNGSGKAKEIFRKIWRVLSRNAMVIEKNGDTVVKLPLWAVLLILLTCWWIVLILLIVSLFFGYRYSFRGEADLKVANDVMEKAANAAEKAKEEFDKI